MKAQAVNFFGCLYDANGIHPDPGKVDAVHALPAPKNVTELQEFLGLVTYLSPFIPGLSILTAPLRELLKKDTDFSWNRTYDITFEWVKEAVISDTTLRYFDPSLPVTIQVDASQVGLGAALLQNSKPIAFASKALTETECRYANIEREMLAAVFRAERFHTYVYGWSFMIKSDHKPLESIFRKNLADTPAWLQCMMLCLQGYDFTIHYRPGKEMLIPDILLIQSQARPRPSIGYHYPSCLHHTRLQRSLPISLCEWPRSASSSWPHHHRLAWGHQGGPSSPLAILAPPRNPHHWGQPSPVGSSPHHSSCWKGENPASTASIPPRNNKVTVAHAWKFLLARHQQGHRRSSMSVWNLHPVPEPECCSTPHTYTHTISPMADVCHRYLHARRNWPPGSGWLLLEDDLRPTPSTQPEQCQQGHLTAERDVFRAWHPWSPLLWQWPTICECSVCWLLYVLGHLNETSSPHYPQSNGFAEACVKSAKHALQQAKYSGADLHLALLALWATPIDSKLPSPAELLYQCWLRTTIPAKICNSNPSALQVHEQIDTHSEAVKSQADKHSKTLVSLYAGQPIAMYDTLRKLWVPATVICILPWSSYLVCTSNGSTYCCMWRHLRECSVKAANTVPSGTTATLQALSSHHFLAAQPASPPPEPCMQPTSAAPATLASQMKQTPAVPATPAVQKNALAPKSVTSHATPVQPWRSSCACMAPRCLIQEI